MRCGDLYLMKKNTESLQATQLNPEKANHPLPLLRAPWKSVECHGLHSRQAECRLHTFSMQYCQKGICSQLANKAATFEALILLTRDFLFVQADQKQVVAVFNLDSISTTYGNQKQKNHLPIASLYPPYLRNIKMLRMNWGGGCSPNTCNPLQSKLPVMNWNCSSFIQLTWQKSTDGAVTDSLAHFPPPFIGMHASPRTNAVLDL